MHILREPDLFVAIPTLLIHAVGSSTSAHTRTLSKRFSSPLNFSLTTIGIGRERVSEGSAFSLRLRWTMPGWAPRSFQKTSG